MAERKLKRPADSKPTSLTLLYRLGLKVSALLYNVQSPVSGGESIPELRLLIHRMEGQSHLVRLQGWRAAQEGSLRTQPSPGPRSSRPGNPHAPAQPGREGGSGGFSESQKQRPPGGSGKSQEVTGH